MTIKQKSLRTAIKLASHGSDGTPTDEQLALINGYTMRDHKADEVYVRQFIVAHTGLDRDKEIISDNLLESMAATLPGKGMFIKHPGSADGDSGPGIGKWFETDIKTMALDEARKLLGDPGLEFAPSSTVAKVMFGTAYIPRTDKHKDTIADIDAGVAGFVSAGFSYSDHSPIEKDGGVVGYLLSGKGEAREASLVWLGAQQGARSVKSANQNETKTEDNAMDLEQSKAKIKTLESEKTTLEGERDKAVTAQQTAETELQAFKDAAGGLSADAIKELVQERDANKNALIDDLVAADRKAGKCGDSDDAVKECKALYATFPMPALKRLHAEIKDKGTNNDRQKGAFEGDPNAGRKDADEAGLEPCPV